MQRSNEVSHIARNDKSQSKSELDAIKTQRILVCLDWLFHNWVHVPMPRFMRSYKMKLQHRCVFGVILPWKQTCNTKLYIMNTNLYQYRSHIGHHQTLNYNCSVHDVPFRVKWGIPSPQN